MKRLITITLIIAAIVGLFCLVGNGAPQPNHENTQYLRVHIRANSNGEADQAVKYLVRDGVVEYLTPDLSECSSKELAMKTVQSKLCEIEQVAKRILTANGYTYGARASLRQENFPTRIYESVTLQAGVYDALILELGQGVGDNWWCVVYPPLCFAGGNGNVIYRSKIAEIIRKFHANK